MELNFSKKEILLDPSVFLYLDKIKIKCEKIYIPESFFRLVRISKDSKDHFFILDKLIRKFTFFLNYDKQSLNLDLILSFFNKNMERIILIDDKKEEVIDREMYTLIYEKFYQKGFDISLSPRKNVFSDIIALLISASKKMNIPILSKNRSLANHIREKMVLLDFTNETMNQFLRNKQELFELAYQIKKTRGIRWFIGLVIGFSLSPLAGSAFALFDP